MFLLKEMLKMTIFLGFTVTSATLLPPLLPPLKLLYIRDLSPKVAEVAVKSQKCII